ncbi:RNA polymerase sigma factor [Pedobacter ginsengisoli]|uniref:RNA polymerase sigma factor n=1 Tax=Pedobacter ginsengisoli TaxID=363852 RepID=UPI00254A7E35|nr:RNA polymerase sigma-70 factor [Pedobacter ginsengisoli]
MTAHGAYTDRELVALLKGGDEAAFTEVYERYWKTLYAIAYNRLRNNQTAEDVVHDVLVSLWKHRDTAEIENLSGYLARATKYMVFHVMKRSRKFSTEEHEMEQAEQIRDREDLEDRLHYKRLLEMISEEVEKLPEKCRLVFKYSREDQLTNKAIAEKMDISQSTVENQMNKALKTLRGKVKNSHLILF